MKYRERSFPSTKFLVRWVLDSILVWPIAMFIGLVVLILMASFFTPPVPEEPIRSPEDAMSLIIWILALSVSVLGGVGFAIGLLQKRIFQQYFHVSVRGWRRLSIVGGALSLPMFYGLMFLFGNHIDLMMLDFILMPFFVVIISAFQWFALRHYVQSAWLWMMANGVGGFLFSILLHNPTIDPGFFRWLVAVAVQGVVTGFAILWLFNRMTLEPQVTVEQENEDDDPTTVV